VEEQEEAGVGWMMKSLQLVNCDDLEFVSLFIVVF